MAICLRYARNRDDAVEIMNDGFLNVFKNITRYDTAKPFKPWLGRIITNKAIDHYRSQVRFSVTESLDEVAEPAVDATVDAKLNYDDLLRMVQALPDGYRTVFNLYAIDGYTHEEIGSMLGISAGTSKSNLFKARQKLKLLIENNKQYIQEREYNTNEKGIKGSDGSVLQGNPEFSGSKIR